MKTVFILGAGASAEIGMPVGNELKGNIADLLDFQYTPIRQLTKKDELITQAFHQYSRKDTDATYKLIDIAHGIAQALPLAISIDNFMDAHRDNKDIEFCGKIGIVRAILAAENHTTLYHYYNQRNIYTTKDQLKGFEKTWYISLFQKITENCQIDELPERLKDITFITFNYDRSLEYFLLNALMIYYGVDQKESASIVNSVNIHHPYGKAGALPFQDPDYSIDFGGVPQADRLLKLSTGIKTFMEQIDSGSEVYKNIIASLAQADRVFFLGFAYHKQNINLLFPSKIMMTVPGKRIQYYGTGLNISKGDTEVIEENIQNLDSRDSGISIFDKTCADFFQTLWHRLSF
jgi:hypothetical protein